MQTIGEYINEIQSRYSKGVKSTDSRLKNRFIYSKIKAVRASLIREKVNKRQPLNDAFYQVLLGVEMMNTKTSILPTMKIGDGILISKTVIPTFVYSINGPIIDYLSNIEGSVIYNQTTWQTFKNAKGRKYTGTKPNYALQDGNIYINDSEGPRALVIKGVFDNPIDAFIYPIYKDCTTNCTTYLDIPFCVDKDMGNTIIEMTSDELLKIFESRINDRTINDIDNT